MERAIATWRDALWEALHGRWSEAVSEFARGVYHSLGDITTRRRIGKAVLKFLARFIPGREREPSTMMKLANFRNLTKDSDAKKPDTNPPKAAEASSARTRGLSR